MLKLRPFKPSDAPMIAGWIHSDIEHGDRHRELFNHGRKLGMLRNGIEKAPQLSDAFLNMI